MPCYVYCWGFRKVWYIWSTGRAGCRRTGAVLPAGDQKEPGLSGDTGQMVQKFRLRVVREAEKHPGKQLSQREETRQVKVSLGIKACTCKGYRDAEAE